MRNFAVRVVSNSITNFPLLLVYQILGEMSMVSKQKRNDIPPTAYRGEGILPNEVEYGYVLIGLVDGFYGMGGWFGFAVCRQGGVPPCCHVKEAQVYLV
jgi:hypothetical protein